MNLSHINTNLVILLSLHTLRESHRLGLRLEIGVEGSKGLYALVGRHDGGEAAIGIVLKLLYSYTTAKAAAFGQLTCVIEKIRMALIVGYTAVVGKRVCLAQGHDLTSIGPGACGCGSGAVRDMLRHATSSIEQLIDFVLINLILCGIHLSNPRTLGVVVLVLLATFTFVHRGSTKAFLCHIHTTQLAAVGNHVAVEFQIVNSGVTPHQPRLTIIINHHGGVDMIPRAVLKEGLSNGILEGTGG